MYRIPQLGEDDVRQCIKALGSELAGCRFPGLNPALVTLVVTIDALIINRNVNILRMWTLVMFNITGSLCPTL